MQAKTPQITFTNESGLGYSFRYSQPYIFFPPTESTPTTAPVSAHKVFFPGYLEGHRMTNDQHVKHLKNVHHATNGTIGAI